MQRRKTSVWTPDTDPRARRQKQENQPPEKESQPQPETQVVQEPKPPIADKPKPKPKVQPEAKSESQTKPAPDEPKEVTEAKAKVKKETVKKAKAKGGKPKKSTIKANRRQKAKSQRALDYFDKQIREKTEMVFIGYEENVDCTLIRMTLYDWVLTVAEKRLRRKKIDFSCCYKRKEAETVKATMITDSAVVNQKLKPIVPRKGRYKVSNEILKASQADKGPITVALRTGQVFTGIVDWFTPFDIAMILSNEGKVKIFRHGVYDVKVDAPPVKDEE